MKGISTLKAGVIAIVGLLIGAVTAHGDLEGVGALVMLIAAIFFLVVALRNSPPQLPRLLRFRHRRHHTTSVV